jgi:hypothetical protein
MKISRVSGEKPPACLGCDRPVYESQQFLTMLRRHGDYLPVATARMVETRPEREPGDVFIFIGVLHCGCEKKAKRRFNIGRVTLPEEPSFVAPTDILAAVRPRKEAPTGDGA